MKQTWQSRVARSQAAKADASQMPNRGFARIEESGAFVWPWGRDGWPADHSWSGRWWRRRVPRRLRTSLRRTEDPPLRAAPQAAATQRLRRTRQPAPPAPSSGTSMTATSPSKPPTAPSPATSASTTKSGPIRAARLHDTRRVSSGKQGKPPSVSHVVNPHRASEIRAELLKLAEAEDAARLTEPSASTASRSDFGRPGAWIICRIPRRQIAIIVAA